MADIGSLLGGLGIGGNIGKAIVQLELDSKKYTAEMEAAKAETTASANSMSSGLTKFSAIGKAAFLAVGVAAVAGIAASIKLASDLNESLNKTKVVFGQASKTVTDFASTAAESFGISERSALEAAANFGNLAQSAGIAEAASADMSVKLVQLAADLASFNNVDPSVALEKLQAGLAGEARPLREFGVFISEARVQTEAYRSGIAKVGQELTDAQKVQARYNIIFQDTSKAQGDFARTVGESLPNQIRVFKAELEDTGAELGKAFLPLMTNLLSVAKDIIPVLKFLATNLSLVLTALVGFLVLKSLPGLLLSIATALEDLNLVAASAQFLSLSTAVSAAGVTFATAATAAAAFATAYIGLTASVAAWDPLGLVDDTDKLNESMNVHGVILGRVARNTDLVGQSNTAFGAGLAPVGQALEDMKAKAGLAAAGVTTLGGAYGHAQHAGQIFTNQLSASAKEIQTSLVGELPAIVGTVTKYKDVFTLKPSELRNITEEWKKIGKTMADDLKVIADSDLKPKMREAIAALPPEMRHAWVEGNDRQRNDIEANIRKTYNIESEMPKLAKQALTGGSSVGKSMAQGIKQGIESGGGAVTAAARQVVTDAITAARQAAGSHSPSVKMHQLGLDLMKGLENGIQDGDQAVAQKLVDAVQKAFDAVKSKADDFKSQIQGAFAGFLDFSGLAESGLSFNDFLTKQLGSSEYFAEILKRLQKAGASKGLLQQVAAAGPEAGIGGQLLAQGPEAIRQANETLAAIQDVARKTADNLTRDYFGNQMDRLRDKLGQTNDILQRIEDALKRGHDHDIVIDGQKLAQALRQELVRTGSRNPDIFGGRA